MIKESSSRSIIGRFVTLVFPKKFISLACYSSIVILCRICAIWRVLTIQSMRIFSTCLSEYHLIKFECVDLQHALSHCWACSYDDIKFWKRIVITPQDPISADKVLFQPTHGTGYCHVDEWGKLHTNICVVIATAPRQALEVLSLKAIASESCFPLLLILLYGPIWVTIRPRTGYSFIGGIKKSKFYTERTGKSERHVRAYLNRSALSV